MRQKDYYFVQDIVNEYGVEKEFVWYLCRFLKIELDPANIYLMSKEQMEKVSKVIEFGREV